MTRLRLNKETLRRLGTETLSNLVSGMPTSEYTEVCGPTDPPPGNTLTGVKACWTLTGTTHPTSMRTTGN